MADNVEDISDLCSQVKKTIFILSIKEGKKMEQWEIMKK